MSNMKCPKKNRYCKPSVQYVCGKDYVCSGFNKKPTKYEKDHIWLCLNGTISKSSIEMTTDEALIIVAALTATLAEETIGKV